MRELEGPFQRKKMKISRAPPKLILENTFKTTPICKAVIKGLSTNIQNKRKRDINGEIQIFQIEIELIEDSRLLLLVLKKISKILYRNDMRINIDYVY